MTNQFIFRNVQYPYLNIQKKINKRKASRGRRWGKTQIKPNWTLFQNYPWFSNTHSLTSVQPGVILKGHSENPVTLFFSYLLSLVPRPWHGFPFLWFLWSIHNLFHRLCCRNPVGVSCFTAVLSTFLLGKVIDITFCLVTWGLLLCATSRRTKCVSCFVQFWKLSPIFVYIQHVVMCWRKWEK